MFPVGLTVSPDGTSVYVANIGDNDVSQFTVGAGGLLSAKSPAIVSTGEIATQWIALSSDGRSAYAVNDNGEVSQYSLGTGGALTLSVPKNVFAGGAHAFAIAVVPDQGPLASFSVSAAPSGSASQFNAAGSVDPDGTIARYDWSFGDGTTLRNGGGHSRPGIRSGARCVEPPRHRKRASKRCTRLVVVGTFSHTDAAGANRLRFGGRVHGRKLAPGSYELQAVARNSAGKKSRSLIRRFRIIR